MLAVSLAMSARPSTCFLETGSVVLGRGAVCSHLDAFSEAILSTVQSLNKSQPEGSLLKPFVWGSLRGRQDVNAV